jgi:hypothetical protein
MDRRAIVLGRRFTQNRPRSLAAAPQNVTVEEKSKDQLSRDFWCCPTFDFCNSIPP